MLGAYLIHGIIGAACCTVLAVIAKPLNLGGLGNITVGLVVGAAVLAAAQMIGPVIGPALDPVIGAPSWLAMVLAGLVPMAVMTALGMFLNMRAR